MSRMLVSNATFAAALIAQRKGHLIDRAFLTSKEESFRRLVSRYPRHVLEISHRYADPPTDPFEKIEVEILAGEVRRFLAPLDTA